MSKTTTLVESQLTQSPHDVVTVELVEPNGLPPKVKIVWPPFADRHQGLPRHRSHHRATVRTSAHRARSHEGTRPVNDAPEGRVRGSAKLADPLTTTSVGSATIRGQETMSVRLGTNGLPPKCVLHRPAVSAASQARGYHRPAQAAPAPPCHCWVWSR
jgi:hypothetical protein